MGSLVVGLRGGEQAFSAADRRLLEDLARHASGAVARLVLTADLRRSRERIITAQEEERRRLRRDLHDGLGPVLTGAAMLIDAARQTAPRDVDITDRTLADAGSQVRSAITDVRRLVYELRPPALDQLGLVGALREQLAPFSIRTELRVCDPFPELPAAVEVAAFRIVLEAVTNASRHAGASCCAVDLRLEHHALAITVSDDGRCGSAAWVRGVGLSSIAERAAELGGTFEAGPTPSGNGQVAVTLPLENCP
jgi:signal transduction histidine kinase